MIDKLLNIEKRYLEIEELLSVPDIISDRIESAKLYKEQKSIAPIVEKFREYTAADEERRLSEELACDPTSDADMRELAAEDVRALSDRMETLLGEIKLLLIPRDPNDSKNVIVEIRAGAGGDEAALFAYVLYRMYNMYADSKRYKVELIGLNETGLGGFKEVTFMINGNGAYSRLKFESGVHRVQRVPETESSGRIHTSTVTVAVLPEAEDVEVEINPADLKIDTIKSSGAGGQHVNKTESAIRLIHKPTGIVIECQDERSQHKNRDKAMKLLRAKLYDMKTREQNDRIASQRKDQVGTGDRSERIRTYNYPQGRVTDHRIGKTMYSIEAFLNGDIDEMIDALVTADTAKKLGGETSSEE